MRRFAKISSWTAGGLILLAALLGGAVFVGGNTGPGRRMIERATGLLTAGNVTISGLAGSFPAHLTAEKLELRDYKGVWLTARHVAVDWTALELVSNHVQVANLEAAEIDMERLPESREPSGKPVSIPRIDVEHVSVARVELGAPLAGVPASLVLKGGAHLKSVEDMDIDAAARRIGGDGEYDLRLHFDVLRMDADLKVHEPAGGPLENILKLPGLGALQATVSLHGPRTAEHLDLAIDAGVLRGRAQGHLDLHSLSGDGEFSLDAAAMSPRADVGWETATARGRWRGSLKAPTADAHIGIVGLRMPGGLSVAKFNTDVTADLGKADLHGSIEGLRILGPQPALLANSPIKVDASMQLNAPTLPVDLTASHRLFALRAKANAAGTPSVDLDLRLPELAALAALAGQRVRGTADIKGQVKFEPDAIRLQVQAGAALAPGPEIWSGAIGDRLTVELAGAISDKAFDLASMKLNGRSMSMTASGSASRDPVRPALRLRWDLNVSDLGKVVPVVAGTLKASGTLSGPMSSFNGDAQLTSTLSIRGSPSGSLSADVKLRGLPSALSAALIAQGSLDGAPLHVEASMDQSKTGTLRAIIRQADWKSAHADGDITLAAATSQTRGQMHLQIAQLNDLQNLLGLSLGGSMTGTLTLNSERGRSHARLALDAQGLTAGEFAANAHLTGEGATDAFGVNLALEVPKSKAHLSAAGTLNLDAQEFKLASAAANAYGQDVQLLAPAKIAFADGLSVDQLKLGAHEAVLQIRGRISPTLDVRASLRQVGPSLVNAFAPDLLAAGTIEGRARLTGTPASPQGQVRVSAAAIRFADDAALGLPAVNAEGTADLKGDFAMVEAHLDAGAASKLSVSGRAPLANGGMVDLKIGGDLDLGLINSVLEARGQHAAGRLTVDATVTGNTTAPEIGGMLDIKQGSLHDYGRGVSVSDIQGEIVGSAGTLKIKSFTASAPPGTLSVSGSVGILEPGLPVDLNITAKNAQPVVSKLMTANLDADLHLSGTARTRLDVAGKVNLNRTVIGIPNSLPPNVAVLDVRRPGKSAAPVTDKPLVIGLDIAVNAPQEILVQGRGLDAEMSGELHVSGTTDSPLVSGGFDLQRGSFSLSSSKLNFTAGRVSFNGAGLRNKIDPTLDFTAQTTVGDYTPTMRITGFADAPQFEFTSVPSLPQDQIMAYLLFGTNVAQLSALQLAQIGVALATLGGVGGDGSLNPLVKVQKSLGLDRLTVGAGTSNTAAGPENSGASIEAGRYISKRVYVEAKQSTQGTSQVGADIDLTKRLKLQTRLGNGTASIQGTTPENDPGSSVGLTYQFEY